MASKEILLSIPSRNEIPSLLNMLRITGAGAEVGVQRGLYARRILRGWSGCRRLYLIDPYREFRSGYTDAANVSDAEHQKIFHEAIDNLKPWSDKITWIRSPSPSAVSDVKERLSFIYIDGNHSYEAVRADIAAWWTMLREGGIIAGHDYVDIDTPRNKFGVKSAVDEWVESQGLNLYITNDKRGHFPSWIVIKNRRDPWSLS